MPTPRLAKFALALFAAVTPVTGCRSGPPPVVPGTPAAMGYDDTQPRYGDATRQTLWDRATPAQRLELPADSRRAGERGWSYARQGRLDDAMRRLNQAWLMDPQNERALWGMATVQFERARLDSAGKKGSTAATLAKLDSAAGLMDDAVTAGPVEPTADLLTDAAYIRATRGGVRDKLGVAGASADFEAAALLLRRAQAFGTTPQMLETWATLEESRGYPRRAATLRAQARELRRDGEVTPADPAGG